MPQIPLQPSRTQLPASNVSAAQLRVADPSGTGLQAVGQDIFSLAPYFLQAERRRAAIDAHLAKLQSGIAADEVLMKTRTDFDAMGTQLLEQFTTQANNGVAPGNWSLSVADQDNPETLRAYGGLNDEGTPNPPLIEGIKAQLISRYHNAMKMARDTGDPEMAFAVSNQLEKDAHLTLSRVQDGLVKLKIGQADARLQDLLTGYVRQATTWERLDESVEGIERRIAQAQSAGLFDPKAAQALREKTLAAARNNFYETTALLDPDVILDMRDVPGNMDPQHLDNYRKLAIASKNHAQSESDRLEKQTEKDRKFLQDAKQKHNDTLMYSGQDVESKIIAEREFFDEPSYRAQLEQNHSLRNERRRDRTTASEKASQSNQQYFLHLAAKLYWDESLAKDVNLEMVDDAVFRRHDLLPEHAAEVRGKIQEALKHHASEDGPTKAKRREALRTIDHVFKVPMQLDPSSAFELQRMQTVAEQQLMAMPGDPVTNAQQLAATYTERVLAVQRVRVESLDRELTTEELSITTTGGVGQRQRLFNDDHTVNQAEADALTKRYPLLKGLFAQHDAKVRRYQQLIQQGQREAKETPRGR